MGGVGRAGSATDENKVDTQALLTPRDLDLRPHGSHQQNRESVRPPSVDEARCPLVGESYRVGLRENLRSEEQVDLPDD